jgi:hypothetical protein
MIMISYASKMQFLMLEDTTIFFDYFELSNDECDTVYLSNKGNQVSVIRFNTAREFMRLMGEL